MPTPLDLLVRDARSGIWLSFSEPVGLLKADTASEMPELLAQADRALADGHWVAGCLSYESSTGLDPAIRTRAGSHFPRAVLGIFAPPKGVPAPPPLPSSARLGLSRLRRSVSGPQYAAAIKHIRRAIHEGDTYQVNYTFRLYGRLDGNPWDLFRHLVSVQHATYGAFLTLDGWAVASASPELLVQRHEGRVQSRPMKSTAPRGAPGRDDLNAGFDLLRSAKERAEHLMIVDMVRNDFSRIAEPNSVRVTDPFRLEAYPTVWQVTSLVEATSHVPFSRLMGAVFPGASITGAPRVSTMALIADLETTPRDIYTGSIGFAAPNGTTQFSVAIRTALVDTRSGGLAYGAGGGVVWDSSSDRELAEARLKARILRHRLPAFDLLETLRWDPDSGWNLLEEHLSRLMESAAVLEFRINESRIRKALEARAEGDRALRIRLTVSRAGRIRVESAPLTHIPAFTNPVLAMAPAAISSAEVFLYHKTTFRQTYDRMRALCPDAQDVILWNERGEVTESTWSNVFVEVDGRLLTPPVCCGLLPGTLRAHLLATGQASESVFSPEVLLKADRVLLGNSVRGLYPAGQILDARPRYRSVTR